MTFELLFLFAYGFSDSISLDFTNHLNIIDQTDNSFCGHKLFRFFIIVLLVYTYLF